MSLNTTHVTGPANAGLSYNATANNLASSSHAWGYIPENNLGYGIGKIVRGAFDYLTHSWQKMWAPEPSKEELIAERKSSIYKRGLHECVQQLGRAVELLRINPRDPSAVKRMHDLAKQYASYLVPQLNDSEQFSLQVKAFKPLAEKIAQTLKPHLIKILQQILPFSIIEHTHAKRAVQQAIVWPASFDLSTLSGTNGFSVPGIITSGQLGWSVSNAGDLNGDGRDDLVLGADAGPSYPAPGTAYVLFGQMGGWPSSFDLSTLDGTNGFAILGIVADGALGFSCSTAGDLNNDGLDDLVLGAPYGPHSGENQGGAYVIFGQKSGWTNSFDLTTLNGTNGFGVPNITANSWLGNSVSTAGDFNGDGTDDLVLGAPFTSDPLGAVYVIFGQTSGWTASFNLTALNGTNGFAIPGIGGGGYFGISVSTAGDIDGNGIDDLILGTAAQAYVLFGQASEWPASFNLSTLDGINGFAITGSLSGASVGTAGDLNGDGLDDLVLGAENVGSSDVGAAYVLFGQASGWPASFNLVTLNGTNGFAIPGIAANGALGTSATAGDLNGDGIDDLVLSAYGALPSGEAYVVFGQASGWPASFNLTILNGTNGFAIPGIVASGELGFSVSTAGDFNGDNQDDLVLGAMGVSSYKGMAYVIFGSTVLPTPSIFSVPSPIIAPSPPQTSSPLFLSIPSPKPSPSPIQIPPPGQTFIPSPISAATLIPSSTLKAFPSPIQIPPPSQTVIPSPISAATLIPSSTLKSFPSPIQIPPPSQTVIPSPISAATLIPSSTLKSFPSPIQIPSPSQTLIPSPITAATIIPSSTLKSFPSPIPIPSPSQTLIPSPISATISIPSSALKSSPSSIQIPSPSQTLIPSPTSVAALIPSSTLKSFPSPSLFFSSIPLPAATTSSVLAQPSPASPSENPTPIVSPSQPALAVNNANAGPPSLTTDQTIGIAVGVSGVVLLGGLAALILLLRSKKKGYFAEEPKPLSQKNTKLDEEQGLANADQDSDLYIEKKDLEIKEKIAEGNFGVVHKGIWQNVSVAIKQLKGQLSTEAQRKLLDEIKIMAKMRSPYVVWFYGVTKEQPYMLVMQYMEGGSLRGFLGKKDPEDVSWKLRLQISQDIGQGLKYLHDRHIVHADLKSLNVLLDGLNHAKLADFGLASVKAVNTEQFYQDASQVKGSLLWMAPELFNQSRHSFATDIYSLGVVLWEIASHQLPYQESHWTASELIAYVLKGKREKFPKTTPEVYKKLAEKCWDGDAKNRPTAEESAKILAGLWQKQSSQEDKEQELVPVKSHQKEPSYLTGTVAAPVNKSSSLDYADNAETKFGV